LLDAHWCYCILFFPYHFFTGTCFRAQLHLWDCTLTVVLFMKHLLHLEHHIYWREWPSGAQQIGVTCG
jgi:hypothetical protein